MWMVLACAQRRRMSGLPFAHLIAGLFVRTRAFGYGMSSARLAHVNLARALTIADSCRPLRVQEASGCTP